MNDDSRRGEEGKKAENESSNCAINGLRAAASYLYFSCYNAASALIGFTELRENQVRF